MPEDATRQLLVETQAEAQAEFLRVIGAARGAAK
jgi:hypothetical protein